jgi:hypothetical protein
MSSCTFGRCKEKVKHHELLKPWVENVSNEFVSFVPLNFELIQVLVLRGFVEKSRFNG